MERFFATCPRGLETALAEELATLDARQIAAVEGGVQFGGPYPLCYRVNLMSRIASRVLWRVAQAPYRSEDDIYAAARKLPWPEWFAPERTIRVHVAAIKSPLKSLDYTTLRIKDAACDAFRAACGKRPDVDTRNPEVRIHAFLTATAFTLYLDTSGDALFKRGYRCAAGEAPLRENLAAGILRLAGWRPDTPLLDPMCGSGTFLTEAAMIACNMAPGANRRFGFEKLRRHDTGFWKALLEQAHADINKSIKTNIYGSDRYGEALKLARANLEALGVADKVSLKQANVLEMPAPADHGILVTNPPYGVRMDEQQALAEFYPKLGDALKKKFSGWTAYILTADLRLAKLIGLKASRRTPLFNGALECRLFKYELVAGSMRREVKTP
ncbi:MAG: class I SAM-dependent RNA methyltransferase [Burkholderiales bacterium]